MILALSLASAALALTPPSETTWAERPWDLRLRLGGFTQGLLGVRADRMISEHVALGLSIGLVPGNLHAHLRVHPVYLSRRLSPFVDASVGGGAYLAAAFLPGDSFAMVDATGAVGMELRTGGGFDLDLSVGISGAQWLPDGDLVALPSAYLSLGWAF